jgi:hypothetical protein
VGCEARKIPAEGDVFFLDFYLYRTTQACENNPDDFVPMEPIETQFPNPALAYFQT